MLLYICSRVQRADNQVYRTSARVACITGTTASAAKPPYFCFSSQYLTTVAMVRRVLSVALLLVAAQLIVAAKLPSFVPTCKKNAPDFDQCLLRSVETIRPYLVKGIPRLKIPPLEPLVIPALEVNRNTDALKIKAKMRDIRAHGGSNFVMNKLKVDTEKLSLDALITIPVLKVTSDYDIDGRVLGLNIKNKGIFNGNFTNVKADVKATGSLIKNKKGVEVLEVKDIKLKIKIDDQKFNFVNKGGKEDEAISRTAMNFYKENRKQIEELIAPVVEETAGVFIRQFANAIFNSVPWSDIKDHI